MGNTVVCLNIIDEGMTHMDEQESSGVWFIIGEIIASFSSYCVRICIC